MKEQKKKRLIAILLFIACVISGYMLFIISGEGIKRLNGLAHADSLIQNELTNFNITDQQVRLSSTRIDSNFVRKTYHISVPYEFSKTQFHAELNNLFHPYSVNAPARVTFPEEDMDIQLVYNNTVIRTLSLQTDADLVYHQNRVSLLVVFEEIPDEDLIEQLKKLGEPIPIVLKVENPMQANELRKKLGSQYERIIFWLQNKNGKDLIKTDRAAAISKLTQLQKVLPEAMMLHYNSSEKSSVETKRQLIAKTRMTFIDAANAVMLHEQMGKASFFQGLDKLRTSQMQSMAVITGNETTLSWLSQKLPELKRAGTAIIPPPKTNL